MASMLVYFVIGLIIGYLVGRAGSGSKRSAPSVAASAPKRRSSPKRRSRSRKRRRR